ncbi:MAG TPA: hypothetical protein PKZ32_13730 [Candidatus Melainabacteria bacterium]|nr:hypothetical protein [Candidatus Melainabacteria bacterium]
MSNYESSSFHPQPFKEQFNTSGLHLELQSHLEQRRNPGNVVEQTADQVRRSVEQGLKQSAREQQEAIKSMRERAEISATLLGSFEIIDGSNRAHKRDGKITKDELQNYRREHARELTNNELHNLQIATRDFATQIARGKEWATKSDIDTYRTSPPVVVRRPSARHEKEGLDDKVKEKIKGISGWIRKKATD